ncbi:MAG: hypothetical protein ACM3JG_09000 [Thiohalocapsa sp.]
MRALVGLYLVIGIVMLMIGFVATGPCPAKNTDAVSDVVFVLGWPIYLYDNVSKGNEAAPQWLHRQACQGGVVAYRRPESTPPAQTGSSTEPAPAPTR